MALTHLDPQVQIKLLEMAEKIVPTPGPHTMNPSIRAT